MGPDRGRFVVPVAAAVAAALPLGRPAWGEPSQKVNAGVPTAGQSAVQPAGQPVEQVGVYYFHQGQDDAKSAQMQSAVEAALRDEFSAELDGGRLACRAVA